MLTVNTFFRLIVLAKRQDAEKASVLTKLIGTLCDYGDDSQAIQRHLVTVPDQDAVNHYADSLVQNRVVFPFPGYINRIPLEQFRALTIAESPDETVYLHYLERMYRFCKEMLDEARIPALTAGLLRLLRSDEHVLTVFYQCRHINKTDLLGEPAHPRRICLEALLTALWYSALAYFRSVSASSLELPSHPDTSTFSVFLLGDTYPGVFSKDHESVRQLLDPEMTVTVEERLRKAAPELAHDAAHYPLETAHHGVICSGGQLLQCSPAHLFLTGEGAVGKTTLLRQIPGLYLPLEHYEQEIHEQFLPDISSWILTRILLKYYYGNVYYTWKTVICCEGDEASQSAFSELINYLSDTGEQVIVLLSGTDEIASGERDSFAKEVQWLLGHCKGIRLILSGQRITDAPAFQAFEQVQILGIPQTIRDSAIAESADIPTDPDLLELLRSPLFLRAFLAENKNAPHTRGELLDAYFTHWRSPFPDDARLLEFIVRYALPFAAHAMLFHHHTMTQADLWDAMQSAKELFLDNEHVYQNCLAPLHFERDALLEAMEHVPVSAFLVLQAELLEHQPFGQIRFTHRYYRSYFAAKYVLHLIDALTVGYSDQESRERYSVFRQYAFGEIWFPEEDQAEIDRMIGEICGDCRNIPDENGLSYLETALDALLKLGRQFPTFLMTENVMRVMNTARNGLVCGVDFSGLSLPYTMPEHTRFSLNGLYPCNFHNTRLPGIFPSSVPKDKDAKQTVYPPEGCVQYYQGCDFRGAVYAPLEENREILRRYGAIVDGAGSAPTE